ncbi:MAG: PHP domain-containing protein [Planctomycetes bacterium]|nr:PHP domain-containing protein [Planctomycetota bacterium]
MELDLHCHTRRSFDCSMDPAKVVRVARSRGLDGIAVTDHDEIEGAFEARRAAGGDLLVIVGEEIDTKGGDIIGLFLREIVREEDPLRAIEAIHAQGGIAVLAHPFAKTLTLEDRVARALDACEGFNARHAKMRSVDNGLGEPEAVTFANSYDLSLVAGSDAHFYREIGRARTILPAASLDEAKEAILRGETALTGRRSGPFNLLAAAALRSLKRLIHPEPD